MSRVWFTSDLHLGHNSILEFRKQVHNQSFRTTEDMDNYIMDIWRATVYKRDTVWVLGDVAWTSEALKLYNKLPGNKILVAGNHDRSPTEVYLTQFIKVYGLVRKYNAIMSHCPLHPQELAFRDWCVNVHGHIHHVDRCIPDKRYVNVNIDVAKRFISKEEIQERVIECQKDW